MPGVAGFALLVAIAHQITLTRQPWLSNLPIKLLSSSFSRVLRFIARHTRCAGRFVIEEEVGGGNWATVFRVHDNIRRETVALKVFSPCMAAGGECP